MHFNQYVDFSDINPLSKERAEKMGQPFTYEGYTYATDARCIIRTLGCEDGATKFYPGCPQEKFCQAAQRAFEFFTTPTGVLTPLTNLTLEPILRRHVSVPAPIDWENPPLNEPEERYLACSSPLIMHKRSFDIKRLLYIRQTLPAVQYYDEPEADEMTALRFVFGESGQGALMPMNGRDPGHLHWNGARYFPHW